MKKYLYLAAMALFACSFTFSLVSCGDDDDDDNGGGNGNGTEIKDGTAVTSVDQLIGEWDGTRMDFKFDATQLTIEQDNDYVYYSGPYTFKDGVVTFTQTNGNNSYTESYKLVSYYNGNAMAVYYYDNQGGDEFTEFLDFVVKEGKSIPTNVKLDGTWYMYEHQGGGDGEKPICCAITIKGNTLELVICPWSRKFTGTFTYDNDGEITFNIQKYYYAEKGIDWITLEADYEEKPLSDQNFNMDNPTVFDFFVFGNNAFGNVGRPGLYEKQ